MPNLRVVSTRDIKKKSSKIWGRKLTCLIFLAIAINSFEDYALAQIKPDNTLSNNSKVSIQGTTSLIEGGTQRGNNLFHSFTTFSVPGGNTAYFNNSPTITNIFSRVTGGFASEIDGILRANGAANLFLLNPNGILFGPNASLNIGGSFLASTANSFVFSDGTQFSATTPQTTPLLTVNVPIGLQFGYNPGNIVVKGQGQSLGLNGTTSSFDNFVGLEVKPGKTLALIGGNVQLDGGLLQAPGGHVQLGGLSEAGTVIFQENGSFVFPTGVIPSDVSVVNKSGVNVLDSSSGSISINAHNIDISGASLLSSGITSNLGAVGNQAGDITLNGTGNITIKGSRIENVANSDGNSGNINVTAGSLSLSDNSTLDATAAGQGNGGKVNINVRGSVFLDNSQVTSLMAGSVGKGGDININTGSLLVTNEAFLATDVYPGTQGNAGSVNINAQGAVTFDGGFIFSRLGAGAIGRAGDINITAKSVTVTGVPLDIQVYNIGQLDTLTFGQGNAGNVTIKASDSVTFSGKGSDIFAQFAGDIAMGNAGTITIDSKVLSISNHARLVASSEGNGNPGNIIINTGKLLLNNGSITTGSPRTSGGSIDIKAAILLLRNSGQIVTSAIDASQFRGGSVSIQSDNLVLIDNSFITSNARNSFGGNVIINTEGLLISNDSKITAIGGDAEIGGNPSLSGKVEIKTQANTDPTYGLAKLATQLVDVSTLIAQGCSANRSHINASSFVATGRGGIPQNPTQEVSKDREALLPLADRPWSDIRDLTSHHKTGSTTTQIPQFPETLVQATSWHRRADGKIELIADPFPVNIQPQLTCAALPKVN
ncbi:filamentous hemagglutinin N-terminal domain-containing protein [Aetokthonos hydrillicola Thurmond2011]|uniref:Filamentous hemagglutinin N-terminal domain-containing protein n=1 Tax=Aetokthonos hydrillicola Thurmond2011 TaxID=2712845 RepID=A0AAP5IC72_9CYAN|nr:filamentous hemagglutinin N-terminal domain-containing protein [Aetokthonos hydrillicola]MBO3460228.1 filamentous hemagglutinin N-terminal domain-containing protein [Aetokthonos hydrillicola CCALA 1050]MBW4586961.1 filamentous hemagglutinin N-terminal domain-containing protein [Aetokthonos hydrillicola CCALA 1050]MDR9897564.1 filamentous hemagglutinin N-terminal domain-containing protein [Aetokthonos hydrillicola Thurmond2011]